MATEYLSGEEGSYFVSMEELGKLTPQEKVAFDDVIIDKAQAGFNIVTHVTENGEFYVIHWKRS